MNFTIVVPEGTTNHGSPDLLCLPPRWLDYITFFAGNYLAHAATGVSRPGETWVETLIAAMCALFVPGSGIARCLRYLLLHPGTTRKDELKRALRAGALCMVVKAKGVKDGLYRTAHADHETEGWMSKMFMGTLQVLPSNRRVHGILALSKEYELIQVPPGTPLVAYPIIPATADPDSDAQEQISSAKDIRLPCNYSIPKVLIGLAQIIISAVTLYQARGNQIDIYGYGAFGLSVAPYAFMSLVNIVTALLTPEYPAMFVVHTPTLEQALKEGGKCEGIVAAVGTTIPIAGQDEGYRMTLDPMEDGYTSLVYVIVSLILTSIPIVIVGALSKFRPGSVDDLTQRAWMMAWLVVGSVSWFWVRFWTMISSNMMGQLRHLPLLLIFIGPLFVPALGGMAIVGKMLQEYGVCSHIG